MWDEISKRLMPTKEPSKIQRETIVCASHLENPFKKMPLVGAITGAISNLNLGAQTTGASIANQRNVSLGNVNTNVTPADQYAALFPGDVTGKLIKQRQTANQNVRRTT